MPTVNINVAITPKGNSIDQGVSFGFTAGAGTPTGVLSPTGGIDLSKQYAAGTAVSLVFQITTPTIKFASGPYPGPYPLSFFGSTNGAKDACWIALQGQNPGIYTGTQFVFGANAMGPGNGSLNITDNNSDGNTYSYALWIWVATQGTSGERFEDDPRIINHSTNK